MRLSLLFAVLAASEAYGSILSRYNDASRDVKSRHQAHGGQGVHPSIDLDVPALPLIEKRAVRSKCSVPVCGNPAPARRRNLVDDDDEFNATLTDYRGFGLERRTMTLPVRTMNPFYNQEFDVDGFTQVIWESDKLEDMATAIFKELGDKPISAGTVHLSGCTTLLVISRTGAYIAHYWENISFAPDPDWLTKYRTNAKCFDNTVVKGLKEGVSYKGKDKKTHVAQVSLTSAADTINKGGNIKGYLIIPTESWDESQTPYANYEAKWATIKKTVGELIPALKQDNPGPPNPNWIEVKYDALNKNDPKLDTTAAGKFLFKYDPEHGGKKKAALWSEASKTDLRNDWWEDGQP